MVSMGSFSARASAKESESMLRGVVGDWVYEGVAFGVGGEVAEGMVYVSITSMRLRVIVAMMGCRLESELMVLKVNFLSSGLGASEGADVDVEVRRAWAGFRTQRALTATACSSVELNSYPPLGMSVTDQRLKPSLMQMSADSPAPFSHFRVLRTPMTSWGDHSSWARSCSSWDV